MAVGRITTRAVDTIAPTAGDMFLWDTEIAGFGVRATHGGTKTYIYQYRLGGRGAVTQRYTIGRHRSPWTAQSARAKAQRLAKQVCKGRNPAAKRRERRRREVELRFDRYVEVFTDSYLKRRWKDWERIRAMIVRHAVPSVGAKKLSEIKRSDLADIYHRLDNTPSVARAMHAALRKMFKWAMSQDDLKHSPIAGVEAPPTIKPRSRYLTDEELHSAWTASHQISEPYGRLFRLLILTGQRRGEVAGMMWRELNRDRAEWILSAERSKNGRSHIIPLSRQALAVLDSAAGSRNWPDAGLVLPSSLGTRLSGFSKIKIEWDRRIAESRQASGSRTAVPTWRLHDLRRTVATGMQALRVRTEIIEAVLNHISGLRNGIVSVYQCYDYQAEKREAMDAWAQHVELVAAKRDISERFARATLLS